MAAPTLQMSRLLLEIPVLLNDFDIVDVESPRRHENVATG